MRTSITRTSITLTEKLYKELKKHTNKKSLRREKVSFNDVIQKAWEDAQEYKKIMENVE